MATLSLLFGLCGCESTQTSAKHEVSEVTSVSISCGCMDRSYSYSFCVRAETDIWYFDASCFINGFESETELKNRVIDGEDIEQLLDMLKQNNSIGYAENYRKPGKFSHSVADETSYSFCLVFSDGTKLVTDDRQDGLEDLFYRLAEKYD